MQGAEDATEREAGAPISELVNGLRTVRERGRELLEGDASYDAIMEARQDLQRRIERAEQRLTAREDDRKEERRAVAAYGTEAELREWDGKTEALRTVLDQLRGVFAELTDTARRHEEAEAVEAWSELAGKLDADATAAAEAMAEARREGRLLVERVTRLAQLAPRLRAKGVEARIPDDTLDRVQSVIDRIPNASVSVESLRPAAMAGGGGKRIVVRGDEILLAGAWGEDEARREAARHPDREVRRVTLEEVSR